MASADHAGQPPITIQPIPSPGSEPRRRVSINTDPVAEGRLHEGYGYEQNRNRKISSVSSKLTCLKLLKGRTRHCLRLRVIYFLSSNRNTRKPVRYARKASWWIACSQPNRINITMVSRCIVIHRMALMEMVNIQKVHCQQMLTKKKSIDIRYLQIINLMGTFTLDTMCISSKANRRIAIRPRLNSHGSMHFVCGVELKTIYRRGSHRIGRNAVRIRCARHSDSFHDWYQLLS